ncbi:unnamed protein product [Eretmochelys imbricata]
MLIPHPLCLRHVHFQPMSCESVCSCCNLFSSSAVSFVNITQSFVKRRCVNCSPLILIPSSRFNFLNSASSTAGNRFGSQCHLEDGFHHIWIKFLVLQMTSIFSK